MGSIAGGVGASMPGQEGVDLFFVHHKHVEQVLKCFVVYISVSMLHVDVEPRLGTCGRPVQMAGLALEPVAKLGDFSKPGFVSCECENPGD